MKRGPSAVTGLFILLVCGAFGQADPSVSPPETRQGSDETLARAESLYISAKAAQQHDDLDIAEKYFRQSLSISNKLAPGSLTVVRSLNGLGDVFQQRGNPPDAEAYYQQALAIVQKLDPTGMDAANSLDGLAQVANDRRDIANVEEYTLQALSIRQRLDSDSLDFALSLNSIAVVHMYRERWDKAEESYKKAMSIQERLAPDSLVLAKTLRNLGNLVFFRHQYDEAELYHRRALAIRERLAPGGLAVADSLRWLGMCAARNDPQERDRYLRAALTIQEKLAPGSVHVAVTLSLLSEFSQNRDVVAAEDYNRQALAIWEKLAPGSGQVTGLTADLGDLLRSRGDLAGAEELARKALEYNRKANPTGRAVGWNLWLLGNIAIERGDLVAAGDYYHEALEISERLDPGGSMPASMMRGLGVIAENQGDLVNAEEYYRRALAIWEKTDPDSNIFAQGLFTVAMVVHDQGHLQEAEKDYRHALAIWERIAPETLFVAQVLGRLGQLANDQKDLAKAEEYHRRAIAIEQKSAPRSTVLSQGLNDLGNILLARGDLPGAQECHQQALAIREKLVPGTASHAETLAALAGIMRRKGEADAAGQYYERALDALENQAARLGSSDQLRAGFRARHASYYKDYIDLLVGQKRLELAFHVLERFRARNLLETLAVARAEIRKGADPVLLQHQRALQLSLAAKEQRRIQLMGATDQEANLAVLDKEIRDLHSQFQEVEDRIRTSSPGYAALMHPQAISAKGTQEQLLDEDTVLLEYSLGEQRSYVWALTRTSLAIVELPKRADIEELAREAYRLLTARDEIHAQESATARQTRLERARQAYRNNAAILSRMLLDPVASHIENKKRLLIVSDGALHYIPFAALPEPPTTTAGKEEGSQPLLMKHEIVNLPSASVLAALRQPTERRKPSKEVAVLADPVFAKDDARVRVGQGGGGTAAYTRYKERGPEEGVATESGTSRSVSSDQLARLLSDIPSVTRGGTELSRLPFSRLEAQNILSLVSSQQAMQALDFRASRATALSAELSQYRVLHFATHGLLDSEHPEWSGLVFSMVNSRGDREDGFLGLEDVYNMSLNADLVVLSACKTGLGKEIEGEGLVGLTQGFMYAGAPQVVASLWSVNDAATAELMGRFYQAMEQQKMSPVAALRQAQLEILKRKRWNDPYYWAAFVIHGDPR
jgi:CHAT domain-containing protein/Tfp pilus assembly protein PilF